MPAITVVGSVNLDLVATCHHLPRPGETITAIASHRYPGGKGANQALAAQRAGSDVTLIAAIGNDGEAAEATSLLHESGMDLSRLVTSTQPTGTAMITVDERGENQIVVVQGANSSLSSDDVDTAGADVVLCQLEIPMQAVSRAVNDASGLVCFNAAPPASVPDHVLARTDVIIVNEMERDEMSEQLADTSALVVVTLGAAGAKAYRGSRQVAEASPPPVIPIDTVGAGDAFCGALVTALAREFSVAAALRWACAAGALATTRQGAQPSLPTADEIDAALA